MLAAAVWTALGAAGCGGAYGGRTLADQVRSWATGSGWVGTLSTLRGDLNRVGTQLATPGPALRTTCDVLVTDSLSAHQQLPTPDTALSDDLSAAYSAAGAAGHDCFEGAGGDKALLARAATERHQALAGLVRAEARYDSLTSSLPTVATRS